MLAMFFVYFVMCDGLNIEFKDSQLLGLNRIKRAAVGKIHTNNEQKQNQHLGLQNIRQNPDNNNNNKNNIQYRPMKNPENTDMFGNRAHLGNPAAAAPPQNNQQGHNENIRFNPNANIGGNKIPSYGSKNKNKVYQMKISDSTECEDDVKKYCHGSLNNFAVLDCLQSDLKMEDVVSVKCQNFLYSYKRNLTIDPRFELASKEVCISDIDKIEECKSLRTESPGFIIPCLIENIENVTQKNCQQYLAKMATIVFSDYRLVYKFIETCKDDIQQYQCGRLGSPLQPEAMHNQGETIDCLALHMSKKEGGLHKKCKKQLLRVLELQSDDFHLDRPLYYACREDRENFCKEIKAGGGQVYECLYKHISSVEISEKCRVKLEFRQRLIASDVKIDKTFYVACRSDMKTHDCSHRSGDEHEDLKRATILLCLESKVKDDIRLKSDCIREMRKVRRNIMEDFNISPDILVGCKTEIDEHCINDGIGGKTIHCLMALANSRHNKNEEKRKHREDLLGNECKAALSTLLHEADVGSDLAIDKVLLKACRSTIKKVCADYDDNDGNTMNCLMDNLDHDDMKTECEERLLEVQYFIVRDFRLDKNLFDQCKKDAKNLCHYNFNWFDPKNAQPDSGHLILPCLYQHLKHGHDMSPSKQLSRGCKQELKLVIRKRAKSVDLEPEIEENCVLDLAKLCSETSDLEHGEEIVCLQDNYDDLQDACKAVIGNITEDEGEDYSVDNKIMSACTPMIKKFCAALVDTNDPEDAADVLECLIEHKTSENMDPKCAVGIEHHQLISLKDFRFNHKFKKSCQEDVQNLCKGKRTKLEVVTCLSEHVRNATLFDKEHRVHKHCRKQLKVELLQREESINLDPKLKKACSDNIEQFCDSKDAGNAHIITCLKSHQKSLSTDCHQLLFKREKDQFAIADFGVATVCKKMIQDFCPDDNEEPDILNCLKKNKDHKNFDGHCRTVILRRQIEQAQDYRLNPVLSRNCKNDIPKFCSKIISEEKNDRELEGKVIDCLKQKFRVKRLSRECAHEIQTKIQEAAVDVRLAPQLAKICENEIKKHCSDDLLPPEDGDQIKGAGIGKIQECLRQKLMDKKLKDNRCIQEVAFLIQENKIDVNVDPLLNTACQFDIQKYCRDIEVGEGKVMSCLLAALEDTRKLQIKCSKLLTDRKQMWEYAAQVAPPESFQEVYESITQSPAKAYFLGVLAAVVAVIFIIGITCGRVTKRVRAEHKNR